MAVPFGPVSSLRQHSDQSGSVGGKSTIRRPPRLGQQAVARASSAPNSRAKLLPCRARRRSLKSPGGLEGPRVESEATAVGDSSILVTLRCPQVGPHEVLGRPDAASWNSRSGGASRQP